MGRRRIGFAILVLLCLPACRRAAMPLRPRIFCAGDSLTASKYGTYVRPLKRLLRQGSRPALLVNGAQPGYNSREYLEYLRRSGVIARIRPHVVLLMLGTNDVRNDGDHSDTADFRLHLEAIVDLLERPGAGRRPPLILLAAIPPIFRSDQHCFDGESSRRIDAEINPVIRDIARRRGLSLVDMQAAFAGRPDLIPGVHPNAAGYRHIAATFFAALRPLLAAARS